MKSSTKKCCENVCSSLFSTNNHLSSLCDDAQNVKIFSLYQHHFVNRWNHYIFRVFEREDRDHPGTSQAQFLSHGPVTLQNYDIFEDVQMILLSFFSSLTIIDLKKSSMSSVSRFF